MEVNRMSQSYPKSQSYVSQKSQSIQGKEEGNTPVRKDSWEMVSAGESGLRFTGELPGTRQLDLYESSQQDGIDWDYVSFRMSGSISLDNGDQLMRHVNSAVAVYVTTKTRLEEHYAGQEEVLTEKLEKLDSMFEQFQRRTVSSYQQSVGGFYEQLGHNGIKDAMGANLSAAIDQRVKDMEAMVKEGRFDKAKENSYQLLEIALDVHSLEEERAGTVFDHSVQEKETYYSLNDLQAAGAAAKEASAVQTTVQNLINDENLEFQMALQHRRLLEFLDHLTAGGEMTDLIRQSMEIVTGHIFDRTSFSAYA